jgi:hypothetical protein
VRYTAGAGGGLSASGKPAAAALVPRDEFASLPKGPMCLVGLV